LPDDPDGGSHRSAVTRSAHPESSASSRRPRFADELVLGDRERIERQLALFAAARGRLPQDPFPNYLAHCRIARRGVATDVLFTSGERARGVRTVREDLLLADFAESPYADLLFAPREGARAGHGALRGLLLERNVVGFQARELVDIVTSDGRLTRRGDGVWRRVSGLPRHVLSPRGAAARRNPPSLIDVHLDPAQRGVVDLPAGRSVLVLGEAGHGKTTVALHRLAHLARAARGRFRAAVLVPSLGLERLLEPLLHSLGVEVDVRIFERWAHEQARRAFPGLGRRVSESATASVVRFKRDPALGVALDLLAARRPGRIDDDLDAPLLRGRARVTRGDLQHLFGDRALIAKVLAASREPIGKHGVAELLEHTRIQFSRRSEREYAHVDRERLRTLDGRPIDAGTPLEDAGSIDWEDCAVAFELDRRRAEHRGELPTVPERFDCIVLDEAQEFAPFELGLVGRSLAPGGSLVVAGDADQQTDPAAFFEGWERTMAALGLLDYERVTLGVNYRCPPKVVRIARSLVSNPGLEGDAPARASLEVQSAAEVPKTPFLDFINEAELGVWLIEELREIRRRDRRGSVAVICRGAATAKRLTRLLRRALDARLVLDGAFAQESSINVTTVDQVKGLEFDYVVVPDASKSNYPKQPSARRALYVAVTRSRHDLVLGSVTERSALLR
jgi:DNA helicase II / ATP-dependent DNA helicase PcrA